MSELWLSEELSKRKPYRPDPKGPYAQPVSMGDPTRKVEPVPERSRGLNMASWVLTVVVGVPVAILFVLLLVLRFFTGG